MKKLFLAYIICHFFFSITKAQNIPNYTQFVLNQYALNPAYAGTNNGIEAITGRRMQWIGFDNAPVTTFGSVTWGWHKNFSYKAKHGAGIYVEDDRQGMFSSKAAYLSYSYHLKIFTGLNIAAGIAAGIRQVGINSILQDVNDPAVNIQKQQVLLYPDVIPGLRLYTKKLFLDISIRQLYKNTLQQGKYEIGTSAGILYPNYIVCLKRKFYLGDNTWQVVPAFKVQGTFLTYIPYTEANLMLFYNRTIGIGASIRQNSFASAILQVKFLKNMVAGFSYDYSINRLRAAAANTIEMVLGFTPGAFTEDRNMPRRRVADCPDFDF